ncbi:nuclear transport factor 2 family protein [Actinocorallia sp. A-T 12471]|uniref:nuclear transport factor 2 family protein n=1 Tax=Actinocorallia sp. A-T 12471 TaxID=3089813 RepID=UPI0029D18769|nr:nuclear transport factor 2 family protein [Actinocorallia sp. A-T 12471]MDX6742922.1 nuclear transport factor 2 family protein [Actinocorallia sp. A-T 12471]
MSDTEDITQLILRERQGRDRGWWHQMRDAYFPDSTVSLSWFTGSGPDFVRESEAMSGRGDRAVHRLGPPIVQCEGDRAFAEVATAIDFQITWDGVPVHLTSFTRLYYRLEKRAGHWGILDLTAVYERDTLTPAIPDQTITIPPDTIRNLRPSYALLALHLNRRGYPTPPNLLGDDTPDAVTTSLQHWLHPTPT